MNGESGRPANGNFLTIERRDPRSRPAAERVRDFAEFAGRLSATEAARQAGRCLDCGVPFCHALGCPLANRLPEIHRLVRLGLAAEALEVLHSTNNFPEITGRVCPAPCEAACTIALAAPAVSIRQIELALPGHVPAERWLRPRPAPVKSGRRVAVIGSGPAGLAAAQQLARRGHGVVVFEKAGRAGGMLRYGIPDFKLEKPVLDRRLGQLRAEGVVFETGAEAGRDLSGRYLRRAFDAVLIASGARTPRDLAVPGRGLAGIRFALDYLAAQNRLLGGEESAPGDPVSARGRDVLVLGGGDTGADCVGTARRQGARRIVQVEILPRPPESRPDGNPWPEWPRILRAASSHEEGCERLWSVSVTGFIGRGAVAGARAVKLEWPEDKGEPRPVSGSEFEIPAGLVLLALGFSAAGPDPLLEELGLARDGRGLIPAGQVCSTSLPGVFAAGDCAEGPSLVATAIASGRRAAESIDGFLRQL